jgi:hypothetical protein
MAKQIKHISLFYDWGWMPPKRLGEFAAWAASLYDSVPSEYRDTAHVEIEGEEDSVHFEAWYERPETDEEEAEREAVLRRGQEELEAYERDLLLTLRAKYGDGRE